MNLELNITNLIDDTAEKTNRLQRRWQELSSLIVTIHKPFLSGQQRSINYCGHCYNFDEFLVLMFEFTQLTSIFYQNQEVHRNLETFCTMYTNDLVKLCLAGRLNYVDEIVVFKKQLSDSQL